MTDARMGRVREIFGEVAEFTGDAQRARLDECCGGDSRLRGDVVTLLELEAKVDTAFLADVAVTSEAWSDQDTPARIGPYKTLEQIGEGSFGVVYLAEQQEPVRRRVALKIIKIGMDTRQVVARFESERQALAMMDHPNVAKVFDAGATETGRPYFVMEHVPGVPITEHCDRQRLTIDERLALFIQVCEAIQHAHQKGIIHRDIKPTNILISAKNGDGVPKVIDFGVAKVLNHKLTERTLFTEQGQLIGTPDYMSPEQAEMTAQDIDTRSDIYSLGVLLYELLTGARPFSSEALREAGIVEVQRIICEEDPPKPSTRLSGLGDASATHARSRRADTGSLTRRLRGDLDWIVMKCLEKNRARRYETASGLAADLRRHLAHEPVLAGPPSSTYRLKKFVRRHRVGVTAAAIVGLALVTGITGVTWGLLQANHAREEAVEEAAKFEEIALFIDEMLAGVRPEIAGDLDKALVRMILDEAARRVDRELSERPVVEAAVQGTIGRTYSAIGEYATAVQHLEHALDTRLRELGVDDPDTLQTMIDLAHAHARDGAYDEAGPLAARAYETALRVFGAANERTLALAVGLATIEWMTGEYGSAEALLRDTISTLETRMPANHEQTLRAKSQLGTLYNQQARSDEAETLHREVLEMRERELEDTHPSTLEAMDGLATALMRKARFAEAEELFGRVIAARAAVYGAEHPATLGSMHNLATLYLEAGRLDEAERAYVELREIRERVDGPEHPDTLKLTHNLASVYFRKGHYDEASALAQFTLDARTRTLGERHPHTLDSKLRLVRFLHGTNRDDEALPLCEGVLAFRRAEVPRDEKSLLDAMGMMAIVYTSLGRYDEAQELNMEVLEAHRRTLGDTDLKTLIAMMNIAWLYTEQDRYDDAVQFEEKAIAGARDLPGQDRWFYGAFLDGHAQTLAHLGRYDEALPVLREAYEVLTDAVGPAHPRTITVIKGLAWLYERAGDSAQANEWRSKLPTPTDADAGE